MNEKPEKRAPVVRSSNKPTHYGADGGKHWHYLNYPDGTRIDIGKPTR